MNCSSKTPATEKLIFKDLDLNNSSDDGKSSDEEPPPDKFPSSDESFVQDAGHGDIDFEI